MFNTVVNTCEVCNREKLTVKALNIMRDRIVIKGNLITINVTLKQLAKSLEGILIDTLNEGLKPNIVS